MLSEHWRIPEVSLWGQYSFKLVTCLRFLHTEVIGVCHHDQLWIWIIVPSRKSRDRWFYCLNDPVRRPMINLVIPYSFSKDHWGILYEDSRVYLPSKGGGKDIISIETFFLHIIPFQPHMLLPLISSFDRKPAKIGCGRGNTRVQMWL